MNEVAYELPYAQGLQLIWDLKICNGEDIVASSSSETSSGEKKRFKELMG